MHGFDSENILLDFSVLQSEKIMQICCTGTRYRPQLEKPASWWQAARSQLSNKVAQPYLIPSQFFGKAPPGLHAALLSGSPCRILVLLAS